MADESPTLVSRSHAGGRLVGFARPQTNWFRPAREGLDRVSLALWPPGPDPVAPEFVELAGQVVAVVVVWPTDERGMLIEGPVVERARLMPWVVSEAHLARLAELHCTWHLARHDLWLGAGKITPCPRSLMQLDSDAWGPLLRRSAQLREDLLQGTVGVDRCPSHNPDRSDEWPHLL